MSALVFTFPHLPPTIQTVTIALIEHLDPPLASALRTRLIAAPNSTPAERAALNFAFVDARLIASARHLRTGVHQALLAVARGGGEGGMKTRTAHSEILFALHPSGNIGDSIRKFGISDTTTSLLLLRVGSAQDSPASILAEMQALLADAPPSSKVAFAADLAEPGRLDEHLARLTSWKDVEAVYKLTREADALRSSGRAGIAQQQAGQRSPRAEGGDDDADEVQRRRQQWVESIVTTMVAMKPVAA